MIHLSNNACRSKGETPNLDNRTDFAIFSISQVLKHLNLKISLICQVEHDSTQAACEPGKQGDLSSNLGGGSMNF